MTTDFEEKLEKILEDNYDPDTKHLYIHKIKDEIEALFADTILKIIPEKRTHMPYCLPEGEIICVCGKDRANLVIAEIKAKVFKELGLKIE